ncbi:hypothetical protein C4K04_4307 [Pseudomonas chlororaphis]|uniref:Uncharacterized protein n=1 Tax=Pseudomonas chlororaphis TaxID=587753 RepID=A0A3G7TSU9_9PSED|nr:hypothetical protein C4K04_4307 [Pseudomonas chlororaphis]
MAKYFLVVHFFSFYHSRIRVFKLVVVSSSLTLFHQLSEGRLVHFGERLIERLVATLYLLCVLN